MRALHHTLILAFALSSQGLVTGCGLSGAFEDQSAPTLGEISVDPQSRFLNFSDTLIGETSAPQSIALNNGFLIPVTLSVGIQSETPFEMVGDSGPGQYTIDPDSSLTFSVVFSPSNEGIFQDIFEITYDEAGIKGELAISLEGEGLTDSIGLTPVATPSPNYPTASETEQTPIVDESPSPSPSYDGGTETLESTPTFVLPDSPGTSPTPTDIVEGADSDQDGYFEPDDCDDKVPNVHPTAAETCDGFDEDCDGLVDEDFDSDDDGYSTCGLNGGPIDCDDLDGEVNPGATENWTDHKDENCDGYITPDAMVVSDGIAPEGIAPVFDSINEALRQAKKGWLIVVFPGVYPGPVVLADVSVTLLGQGKPEDILIVPLGSENTDERTARNEEDPEGGPHPLLRIIEGEHHIEGLSIKGGAGPGIAILGGHSSLSRLIIEDNQGSGLHIEDSDVRLDLVQIRNNQGNNGGGIAIQGGRVELSSVWVEGNEAVVGGGIFAENATVVAEHIWVKNNNAIQGGGLFFGETDLEVDNGIVEGNTAAEKGAGLFLRGGVGGISNLRILGNGVTGGAQLRGGGVYAGRSAVAGEETREGITFKNVIVAGNRAGKGGGLAIDGGSILCVNCAIGSNAASDIGGGVLLSDGKINMVNSIVAFNGAVGGANVFKEGGILEMESSCLYLLGEDDPAGGLAGAPLPEAVWVGDPGYINDGSDGLWRNDDYHLKMSSQAIGTGSAFIVDPDESPSDLGPFGGEGAAGFDSDGDGLYDWWDPSEGRLSSRHDCDDANAEVGLDCEVD